MLARMSCAPHDSLERPSGTRAGQGGDAAVCVDFGDACTACQVAYCYCYGQADCGLYAQMLFRLLCSRSMAVSDAATRVVSPPMSACLAKPACTDLLGCLGSCASVSCQEQCYVEHPAALPEGYAAGSCIQQQCSVECG